METFTLDFPAGRRVRVEANLDYDSPMAATEAEPKIRFIGYAAPHPIGPISGAWNPLNSLKQRGL